VTASQYGVNGSLNGAVVVKKVKDTDPPIYRPAILEQDSAGVHRDILTLMKQCWAEGPSERPSFNEIVKTLKIINEGKLVLFIRETDSMCTSLKLNISVQLFFRLYWCNILCVCAWRFKKIFIMLLQRYIGTHIPFADNQCSHLLDVG